MLVETALRKINGLCCWECNGNELLCKRLKNEFALKEGGLNTKVSKPLENKQFNHIEKMNASQVMKQTHQGKMIYEVKIKGKIWKLMIGWS